MSRATLFIDCEYNGWGGALISMALVPLEAVDHWVRQNVLPLLDEDKPRLGREEFARQLSAYLAQWPQGVHVVADWPEDIELFCRALITGPGWRVGTPPLTMEVRRDIDTGASAVPHHALHDAVALRNSWMRREAEQG